MCNYEIIKKAILEKKQILATYNGNKREMCPHALGTKNGRTQCLFYQFAGESSSGQITLGSDENWRCIPVDKLENVSIREGEWYTSDNHSRSQTCVDSVDVEVSY